MRRARRPLPYPRTYNPAPFSPVAGGNVQPHGKSKKVLSIFDEAVGAGGNQWSKAVGSATASVTSVTAVDAATPLLRGSKAIQCYDDDASGGMIALLTPAAPLDLTTHDLIYFAFHVSDASVISGLDVRFCEDAGGTKYYVMSLAPTTAATGWNQIVLRPSQLTAVGSPTGMGSINNIRLRVTGITGNALTVTFNECLMFSNDLEKAIVCLTFDDGWLTQYTAAKPLMDQYGFPGVASPMCYAVQGADASIMTVAQMMAMKQAGWEIGNHGYSHTSQTTLTEAESDTDIRRGWDWLVDNNLDPVDLFVYPTGTYNASVLNTVHRYHNYARGIYNVNTERTPQFFPQPLIIKASGPLTAAGMATNVDAAVTNKSIYVNITHKVETNAGSIIFPTAEFETAMDHLKTHVDAGELEVLNWTDTLKRMRGEAI